MLKHYSDQVKWINIKYNVENSLLQLFAAGLLKLMPRVNPNAPDPVHWKFPTMMGKDVLPKMLTQDNYLDI